ncbi:DNA (cytosine-5-)-methyltransferase [Marinicella gelatinilytica]|uniref:DNA (cytosine-5-)-methyltransferase n=1 Tax=Marinicella gelatinilytica TaxID=2996017 RepID=UPI002260BA4E|nr:DNA (cytosine-5-)-methyltransferase [Marinicella gelatinilytica]MCX7544158.1 DNA (cytosine-5-)-methyltransferase [Marinicella gelatinilytica]
MEKNKIKVVELFAGVGGFRLGLEKAGNYEVVWSNQWEPSTKAQHASWVYEARFGKENHSNENIETVIEKNFEDIPDHDLLVGGFPCQDYSVATTLKNSKGVVGKKGILWWSIYNIINKKERKPKYLFFENVDRLLKSPASQRGRDFALMLESLNQLGYAVEWRVINAADYGMPQRRRRVFFLGYHKSTKAYQRIKNQSKEEWISKTGVIANAFPIQENLNTGFNQFKLDNDVTVISDEFNKGGKKSLFENTGIMIGGEVKTMKTYPKYDGKRIVLRDIVLNKKVEDEFYIDNGDEEKWNYLKGAKKEIRKSKSGHEYHYAEGGMVFPDALNKPSRTIITGEGGKSPSRFKHVIETKYGLRRLTPVELEKLNMFPENHTKLDGISDTKRAFFMGNALVVGVIENIGKELYKKVNL